MIETRMLYSDDLRQLCIKKQWYTNGTNDEYAQLLDMAIDLDHVRSRNIIGMAENILQHSITDYTLPQICFEISEICHSFFK